jgi:hypothetical protein
VREGLRYSEREFGSAAELLSGHFALDQLLELLQSFSGVPVHVFRGPWHLWIHKEREHGNIRSAGRTVFKFGNAVLLTLWDLAVAMSDQQNQRVRLSDTIDRVIRRVAVVSRPIDHVVGLVIESPDRFTRRLPVVEQVGECGRNEDAKGSHAGIVARRP